MIENICALPTCDVAIGDKPFRLGLHPGEYCSRECVNEAFTLKKSGKPFSKDVERISAKEAKKVPHVTANDFGDVGVIRHFCDNAICSNPGNNPVIEIDGKLLTVITLCWKGRFGEYCSNECLKTEKEKKMSDDPNDSPLAAGDATPAPPKKGTTKKGATKKAPPASTKKSAPASKKAAAPTAKSNNVGRSKFDNDATITVKSTDHGKTGKGAEVLNAFKSGITVAKYKDALEKKGLKGMAGWGLKYATENNLITVK